MTEMWQVYYCTHNADGTIKRVLCVGTRDPDEACRVAMHNRTPVKCRHWWHEFGQKSEFDKLVVRDET
jgi:hypothetical protein